MVFTRGCAMDLEKKNKNEVKNSRNEKTKMKANKKLANSSNAESEDEEEVIAPLPSGSSESSFKVTLKKTRSCSSSTSSRESTQSFKIVRNTSSVSVNVSSGEDNENQKDYENTSDKQQSEDMTGNEKESEESQNANSSGDDNDVEVLSSCDSQESFADRPNSPTVPVKDEQSVPFNTVVDLKTEEILQTPVKKEYKIHIKSLKEELLKEGELEREVVNLDINETAQVSESQNGVAKKEETEHKSERQQFIVVRSDLLYNSTVDQSNMPLPVQIEEPPSYLSQNGAPLTYVNMCDVCGLQFDSSELLIEHKATMKHFKCTFKDCEMLMWSSQQELLDHQHLIHNILPSPVQQLAHQVQRLPVLGFDQQLQSGVPPLTETLPPSGVPKMYTQTLRMPNQPVPMQRAIRPMIRPTMSHMISGRGRAVQRASRGRPSINSNMGRGRGIMATKRPASMPAKQIPPPKRSVPIDRNSYTNTMKKSSPQIVQSLSESLTKSVTSHSVNKPSNSSQQDVVNLFSKRGLTISTVDSGKNSVNLPAGLSLNSAVSIIPTSPLKRVDTVDLTGPDKPREKKFWPCEVCSKTYASIETLYEHISIVHKSYSLPYKCTLCSLSFPNGDILNRHKLSYHKSEVNTSIPFVIPILDLTKPATVSKLRSMGITNYVPVTQISNNSEQFGVPIMSIARPGSMEGLKCTNFFNLGSIRKI